MDFDEGYTRSAFQKHAEMYRFVIALPLVLSCMMVLDFVYIVTGCEQANATTNLHNPVVFVVIEVSLCVICHF